MIMNQSAIIVALIFFFANSVLGRSQVSNNDRVRITNRIDRRHLQVTLTNSLSRATTLNPRVTWIVIDAGFGDNSFYLENELTGGLLEANSLNNNVRVNFNTPVAANNRQRWRFVGSTLVNVGLSRCLDVNNDVIITKPCNNSSFQNWTTVIL